MSKTLCLIITLTRACRVTSVIISNFILNLRNDTDNNSSSAVTQSSVQFAQRVEDGLGGSLNSTWGSGANQDQDDNEDSEHLHHPQMLSTGSLNTENIGNDR